jgi:hypothetical protein
MERDYLEGQKALDTMMEVERLKDYQQQVQREALRKQARFKSAAALIEQIKQRDIERQNRQQIEEMEKAQMRRQAEEQLRREEKDRQQRKEKFQKLYEEAEAANKVSIALKRQQEQEEKENQAKNQQH